LQANFVETNRPTLTITSPTNRQILTSAVAPVSGTAKDVWGLQGVWLQVNSNAWIEASTTNAYANWNTNVTLLVAGTNVIKAYALNLGGNASLTNSVSVVWSGAPDLRFNVAAGQPKNFDGLAFSLVLPTSLNGRIQVSTDLVNWVDWMPFTGTNGAVTFHDPSATNGLRFYRAVVP